MTPLEEARLLEADIEAEMAELAEQLVLVRQFIAEEAAKEAQSPYWGPPDALGAQVCLPLQACHDTFMEGSRAEQYYAATRDFFAHTFFASLTEDISPANKAHYSRAATRYFGILIARAGYGRGPIHAETYDADNQLIEGVYIPYQGSRGEHGSTVSLRDYWSKDSTIQRHRRKADNLMRSMDREYRMAQWRGNADEWLIDHPHYVPLED